MTKITKKAFIDALAGNTTTLEICTGWRPGLTLEKVKKALDSLESLDGEKRTVKKQNSNSLEFNTESKLYFDGEGVNEYYAMRNKHGLQFYIFANTADGGCYGVSTNFMVYGVVIAENDEAKRTWNAFEISNTDRAENFRKILLQNNYVFNTGMDDGYKHFQVFCSENEAEMLLKIA